MIYSVAPKEGGEELYKRLRDYYSDDPNVTVIVDRRDHDRRARSAQSAGAAKPEDGAQRRQVRDRRRARVVGEVSSTKTVDG
ncbi:MAG: hypothetical protein KGJ43_10165 [Acidobacteriota bacterium]|nr:hypothetical protein [Acidobacteriota bacterium]